MCAVILFPDRIRFFCPHPWRCSYSVSAHEGCRIGCFVECGCVRNVDIPTALKQRKLTLSSSLSPFLMWAFLSTLMCMETPVANSYFDAELRLVVTGGVSWVLPQLPWLGSGSPLSSCPESLENPFPCFWHLEATSYCILQLRVNAGIIQSYRMEFYLASLSRG